MYTYIERIPEESEYNRLRELAGWGALESETVGRSLPNSVYAVVAEYNNEVIALARVVGDGGLCFYIQEIIVHPNHRRRGIASTFMQYIFEYLKKATTKRSYIGVFSGKELEPFYEKYGFWKRPTSVMGHGMMQFWDDPECNDCFRGSKNKGD